MNKPCEFHDYLKVRACRLIEDTQHPDFKLKWREDKIKEYKIKNRLDPELDLDEAVEDDDLYMLSEDGKGLKEQVKEYLDSQDFREACRKDYSEHVQRALLEKKTFTFVEAIEEFMDLWSVGRNLFHYPVHNLYIPVRNTIMKKPNLNDEDVMDDELGYMYNNYDAKDKTRQRFGPNDQLSPLRANRMGPGRPRVIDSYHRKKDVAAENFKRSYFKFRRLSHLKTSGFSTDALADSKPREHTSMLRTGAVGVSMPSHLFSMGSPFRQN